MVIKQMDVDLLERTTQGADFFFLRISMLSLQFFMDSWLKLGQQVYLIFPLSDLQHQLWSAFTFDSLYCLTMFIKEIFACMLAFCPKQRVTFSRDFDLYSSKQYIQGKAQISIRMSVMDLRCKDILNLISTWYLTHKYQITFIPNWESMFKYSWIIVFFCQKMWSVVESMIQKSYSFLLLI